MDAPLTFGIKRDLPAARADFALAVLAVLQHSLRAGSANSALLTTAARAPRPCLKQRSRIFLSNTDPNPPLLAVRQLRIQYPGKRCLPWQAAPRFRDSHDLNLDLTW